MQPYYLHVGLHKTASTFLQKQVFPRLQNVNFISRAYTQHNHAFNKMQYADESLYDKEAFLAEVRQIPGERVLLSDESLSGKVRYFNYINRSIIAKRLQEALPEATVILFVRGQVNILRSHYSEYVKRGGFQSMPDFFWRSDEDFTLASYQDGNKPYVTSLESLYYNTNTDCVNLDNFLYYELISMYRRLFNKVEVLLFEDLQGDPQRVIQRLTTIFEGPLPAEAREAFYQPPSVNTGRRLEDLEQMRVRNRLRKAVQNRSVQWLLERLERGTEHERVSEAWLSNFVGDYYHKNNRRVIQELPAVGFQRYPEAYPTS